MKLVIKDNKVLATHDNNQEVESLYEGCSFVIDNNFIGQIGENYEITQKQLIQTAKATRDKVIDAVTSSVILDQLQKEVGIITQDIYDSRFAAKANMYQNATNEFYITTGLTAPTSIEV